ncbi:Protein Hikeshi [Schistosoma japonicum]|uniref:Protein Hikeshi n=1 Tax=Schistosoma japonicum TaxID=6182 RepID=Q5DEP8_SCHJA|nr:SJCHGC06240 protein [Schistosoma japonicum]KAH8872473.1 Protein Hikeshi [Schistosoma japonicum]TNN13794.1 Protein Hikeshi [Schistosoma japonicum]CAX71155.1 hypothetical protein [Schistosoma japonicum]CAX71156.1 hypothetical protein [Schistosoma japonicum]
MFAALVAGRLVQTNFNRLSESQFLLDLLPLNDVNHIVVFLTGETAFPPNMGGGVFLGIQQNGVPNWYFLGVLTNEKPSAIYRISKLTKSAQLQNGIHPFGDNGLFQCSNGVVPAQIGISVDLLTNLPQQTEETTESINSDKMTQFTRFAAESLFNYVASFARDNLTSDPLVPMSSIKRWFDTMLQKLSLDASFWQK